MKTKGRPSKFATPEERQEAQRRYLKRYYEENREKISKKKQKRWKEDAKYRDSIRERSKKIRAVERAQRAKKRIEVEEKANAKRWADVRLLSPRVIRQGGQPTLVYSTGALAKFVCRTPLTVLRWIGSRALPGCTFRDAVGRYWFSAAFMRVVKEALQYTYLVNGHRPTKTLRQVIIERLEEKSLLWERFHAAKETAKVGRKTVLRKGRGGHRRDHPKR